MMTTFEVRKNIPKPKTLRPPSATARRYPFDEMEVGDMFFIPDRAKNTFATHASMVGKQMGRKFSTRMMYMKDPKNKGHWVECEQSDPKAVLGIGVFRDA